MTQTDDLKAALAETRGRLMAAVGGVSEQQFKRRPAATPAAPAPWCIAEVLAHLLHDEDLWSRRIEHALTNDGTEIEPSPRQESAGRIAAARQAPVPQLIHGILASRRDLELRLANASRVEGGMERSLRHTARGVISVRWMATKVIEHEGEHTAQIEAIRAQLGVAAAIGKAP